MTEDTIANAKSHLREHGWCVVPDVLTQQEAASALERLWAAAEEYRRRGGETHIGRLDPNAANVRIFNLLELDQTFRDLIRHPRALEMVEALLGPDFIISNFTANIARPGSGSMSLHSDLGLIIPEPWLAPWSINIIWCLTDVTPQNGATRFVPGSHKVQRLSELGEKPVERLKPFTAKAGSICAMDGRMWHTSGRNITADQDRALMFGYYARSFLRPQLNWNAALSPQVQQGLDPDFRRLLALDPAANLETGRKLLAADVGQNRG